MSFNDFETKTALEVMQWAMNRYGQNAGLASSFGMEDMILIDMLTKLDGKIAIFTLDTGRLHEETYEIMERARSKYGITIQTYFPNKTDIERLHRQQSCVYDGMDSPYVLRAIGAWERIFENAMILIFALCPLG